LADALGVTVGQLGSGVSFVPRQKIPLDVAVGLAHSLGVPLEEVHEIIKRF
jgi:hypothetical protein